MCTVLFENRLWFDQLNIQVMNPVVSSRHTEVRESPANNQLNIIRQKRKKNQMGRSKEGSQSSNPIVSVV